MAQFKVPYLKWRKGRPRWEPGPKLRDRGFRGQDLKDGRGDWLDMGAAIVAAQKLNAETKLPHKPRAPRATGRLLADAWKAYTLTPEFRNLRERTRRDYHSKAKVFLDVMGDFPLASIGRKLVKSFWREMHDARGHAMANGVIAILRRCLSHAVDEEWIAANPAANLRLKTIAPRVVYWLPSELEHLVATADAMGEFGMGDAIVLAVHTAQRQGDVLALPENTVEGGQVRLKQSKTGQLVAFPATNILAARAALAVSRNRERFRDARINFMTLVMDDRTGRPFNADTFRHRFAALRARAAIEMPSVEEKTFQDLRDTALTRLYLAGLSILRIAAISGHEIRTVDQVLRHYIALTEDDGTAAIAQYETWLDAQGVKV